MLANSYGVLSRAGSISILPGESGCSRLGWSCSSSAARKGESFFWDEGFRKDPSCNEAVGCVRPIATAPSSSGRQRRRNQGRKERLRQRRISTAYLYVPDLYVVTRTRFPARRQDLFITDQCENLVLEPSNWLGRVAAFGGLDSSGRVLHLLSLVVPPEHWSTEARSMLVS